MSTKQLKADHFPREFYTYFMVCNRFQLVSFFLVNINFLTEFEKIEFLSFFFLIKGYNKDAFGFAHFDSVKKLFVITSELHIHTIFHFFSGNGTHSSKQL